MFGLVFAFGLAAVIAMGSWGGLAAKKLGPAKDPCLRERTLSHVGADACLKEHRQK